MGLTNQQQAWIMLAAFLLPPLITWTALGFPTGRSELGILIAAMLSGILAFIKEISGGATSTTSSTASTPAATTVKPVNLHYPKMFFSVKRRLIFLQLRK